MKVGMSTSTDE